MFRIVFASSKSSGVLRIMSTRDQYLEDAWKQALKYLIDNKQYIYVNLHQVNKAFEQRFYYLSQLFIGNDIGEEEWLSLWKLLYKERKKALYPYFYKNEDSIYRSIFLIITGISAIQYLCKDNVEKSSKFLNYIWEAIKEIH